MKENKDIKKCEMWLWLSGATTAFAFSKSQRGVHMYLYIYPSATTSHAQFVFLAVCCRFPADHHTSDNICFDRWTHARFLLYSNLRIFIILLSLLWFWFDFYRNAGYSRIRIESESRVFVAAAIVIPHQRVAQFNVAPILCYAIL